MNTCKKTKKAEILIITEDSSFLILIAGILLIQKVSAVLFLSGFRADPCLFLFLCLTFQPFRYIINIVN